MTTTQQQQQQQNEQAPSTITINNGNNDHEQVTTINKNNNHINNNNQQDNEQEEQQQDASTFYKKLIIALFLIGFIVFVVIDSLTNGYIGDGITSFLEWIENNPIGGFFVFMIVYFIATVLFVPGSVLTLGAGFVFANAFGLGPGVLLCSLSVFIGASGGAIAAFLLGRFLLRDWVSTLTKKYAIFEALDIAFEEKGFRIMALLRLSPIIPFNAINYIAGVTAISFWSYVWAFIAILPGTVLYVFLGASAGSLADSASSGENSTVTLIVIVVGLVFGVIAVGVTSYYAKNELNRVVEKRRLELEAATKEEEGADGGDDTNNNDVDDMEKEDIEQGNLVSE